MLLEGKTAVITGAARGIGLACAERFAREGARVMLSDVDDGPVEAAAEALAAAGHAAAWCHCDVRSAAEIETMLDRTEAAFGRIDSVIANAGIVHQADILELAEEDLDRVLSVNLRGAVLTGQRAAQRMVRQAPDANGERGTVINMSSLNGLLAIPAIAPYVIAKGGLNQWTKCLAIRLAPEGVRVNGIGPGSISTEMFQAVSENPERYRQIMSRTPMLRPGEPDEVARVAVFLASEYSSYVTGETVIVDGGRQGLNYVVPVE